MNMNVMKTAIVIGILLILVIPVTADYNVTGITPTIVIKGDAAQLVVAGNGFPSDANTIVLSKIDQGNLTFPAVLNSPTQMTTYGYWTICGSPGTWNVSVSNGSIYSAPLDGGFTILAPEFNITGFSPDTGLNNASLANVYVYGYGFPSDAVVTLNMSGQSNIAATNVVIYNCGRQLSCTLPLTGKHWGSWNVTVSNSTATSVNRSSYAFTIAALAPTLTSINQTTGTSNFTAFPIKLTGTHFLNDPSTMVMLWNASASPPGTFGQNMLFNGDGTEITCSLDLTNKVGDWNIRVDGADGQSTSSQTFRIYNISPIITTVDPNTGLSTNPNWGVTIWGSNFTSGVEVNYTQGSNYIPKSAPTTLAGSGQISTALNLVGVPGGFYNVTVTNPGPLYNNTTQTNKFWVKYPSAPTIINVIPSTGSNISVTPVPVQIQGSGFYNGVGVVLNKSSNSNITGTVISSNLTTINCTFDLLTKTAGSWNVIVTNNDTQTNTLLSGFTIAAPPASITNLHNTTYLPSSITWNWTDSTSTDFSYVMVYLDGAWNANVTKGYQNYTALSLSPGTSHEIATHTVGTTGLINPIWVNLTNSTAPAAISDIGVFQNGFWFLDFNGNGTWDGAAIDRLYYFGPTAGTPEVGDWSGSETAKVGSYQNGAWYLDYNGNGIWDPSIDKSYSFGATGWTPTVGDWSATGTTKIGVYQNGIWYLDYNGNGTWDSTTIDRLYYFGATGWTPEVGDWSGTGTTKIGVYLNGVWYLDYNGNGTWDGPSTDRYYNFGATGWTPVIGDWSGTGTTKIGVYQNGAWYLDYNGNGVWDGPSTDRYYNFGTTGWTPVIGDWNDDGSIEIGVYQNGVWYLDYNGNGAWEGSTIDRYYNFGTTGWTPMIGVWS